MSTALLVLIITILALVILFQIGKLTELSKQLRTEEEAETRSIGIQARWLVIFMICFLAYCIISAVYYKDYILGYGPHSSASEHGVLLDGLFNTTLIFTGIVFFITQIALFVFAYKYRRLPGRKALFLSHNNKLEIWWSVIPAVVMCGLVINGLFVWNKVMADIEEGEDHIEIEATGMQFSWTIRYPGADGALGAKDFKKITSINPLGQDWTDVKNLDDIHADEIVLPINKKVRVRINSRDVLHNFYLPHFRVKMDAVPGIPTYFVFTPRETTEDYREKLRRSGKYDFPYDETDPESPPFWQEFNYELACAELCGSGHFSMRKIVRIVSEQEYETWLSSQNSKYLSSIRNTDEDPFKGVLLENEAQELATLLTADFETAMAAEDELEKIVTFRHVHFETGSAKLKSDAKYELNALMNLLVTYPNTRIELGGHTDNTGDPESNLELSQQRAEAVRQYLTIRGADENRISALGYGSTRPVDSNDTDEGRANNRRTEIKIFN